MENQANYRTNPPRQPGQGGTREQYEFAASMVAGSIASMFLIAGVIAIVKFLNYIFF